MARKNPWPGQHVAIWRQLRKRARKAGGVLISTGSSEMWRMPDGQIIKLDARHPNQQVRKSVVKLITKAIRSQKPEAP